MRKIEITVPTSIKDITLGQYQAFRAALEASKDDSDTFVLETILEVFCGLKKDDMRLFQSNQIDEIVNKMQPMLTAVSKSKYRLINRFKMDGVEYGFIPNIDKISFGENADANNSIYKLEELHLALAVLYRPIVESKGDKYRIEEYDGDTQDNQREIMKNVPLDVALGAQVFFWTLIRDLQEHIPSYLQNQLEMRMKDMSPQHRKQFTKRIGDTMTKFTALHKEI